MSLPNQGIARDTLLAELERYKRHDIDWKGGRAFAYTYDPGAEAMAVGKIAFASFLTENALDPTVYPSLMRLENEIIGICATHLNLPDCGVGTFTSGGTESILLAVKSARDLARATQVTHPKLVMPVTGHAAFHKAAAYFDIELVLVEVDPHTFRAVPELIEAAIDEQTILVVASSPGYAHGVMDPIVQIGADCARRNVLFHVDACVGGWMLPFWRRLQQQDGVPAAEQVPAFDFAVPGVTSMSVDLHKYGFCPKGASVVLFREANLRAAAMFTCSNWTGYTVINPSVQSSKSGGPLAAAWSVLRFLGDDGYMAITRQLRDATLALRSGIDAIDGIEIMGQPEMCLFTFCSDEIDVFHVADEMKTRGWYIQPQLSHTGPTGRRYAANVHLSLNSAGTLARVAPFLADLQLAVDAARVLPDVGPDAEMGAMLAAAADVHLDAEEITGMLSLVGVGVGPEGPELPERMAGINRLIDAMPAKMEEAVLGSFLSGLFTPAR